MVVDSKKARSIEVIKYVLERTSLDLEVARSNGKPIKEDLRYAIYFARHFGSAIASAFRPEFGADVMSGEVESTSAHGAKRVDVSYSTRASGLGFMVSLKSVHRGEAQDENARFTHNLKRNDEELRVEATALHLRQPYAVLAAVMILPFEACYDAWKSRSALAQTSSFARWVRKFWSLAGRIEPEDPPNQFELVFIALYKRDGSDLGFYEVGGGVPCPREGPPRSLLQFDDFIVRIRDTYYKRNSRDFYFEGETNHSGKADDPEENGFV